MSLGAHCSIAKGLHNAFSESAEIQGNATQIFTSNQRTWRPRKPISSIELLKWEDARSYFGIKHVVSHASYLINLGASSPEILQKSCTAFREEILRCQELSIDFLNFHPGSSGTSTKEECLVKIVQSILPLAPLFQHKKCPILLIETMAGQGNQIGRTFEEIHFLVEHLKNIVPIGVCLDTCHVFAAGYDMRSSEALEITLNDFSKKIGLQYLQLLHLNDSVKAMGSRVDRHASLGQGEIGWHAFEEIMRHPATCKLPKILETPNGLKVWAEEIRRLKTFAKLGN